MQDASSEVETMCSISLSREQSFCIICLVWLFCLGAWSIDPAVSKQRNQNLRDAPALPAPTINKPPLTAAQLKTLKDKVTAAKDIATLVNMDKQIAAERSSCSISGETAGKLILQILEKEKRAIGPNRLEIAYSLSDLAECYPGNEETKAVPLLKEALSIALKQASPPNEFVLQVRSSLARELVLSHAGRSQITEICPLCPHCLANASVVPVFGYIPYSQQDYGYGFVNRSCGPSSRDWYCRKCKGSFFPYSTKVFIMDHKPL